MKRRLLRGLVFLAVASWGCAREAPPSRDGLARLEVFPAELVLLEDDEFRLQARALDAEGRELGESGAVQWSSEDPDVATVTFEGVVRAISPGTTTVRAQSGSLRAAVVVRVQPKEPFRLVIVGAPSEMHVGAETHLNAHLYPAGGDRPDALEILWSVSDPLVAEIREREVGVDLVALVPGKVTVRAAVGRLEAEVEVRVLPHVARIELEGPTHLPVGEKATLRVRAYDEDETPLPTSGLPLGWAVGPVGILDTTGGVGGSDRLEVVGVNAGKGYASVTAGSGLYASMGIRVGGAIASIELSPTEADVVVGDFLTFQVVILDADGNLVHENPVWTIEPEDALVPAPLDHPTFGWGHFRVARPGLVRVRAEIDGLSAEAVLHSVGAGPFVSVQSAERSLCGLTVDGEVVCYGEILRDDGTWESVGDMPTRVSTPEPLVELSMGPRHACGLTQDGRAYCIGENWKGALGTGDREDRFTFTPVATDLRFREIRAGSSYTCAISTAAEGDNAYCWGDGTGGKLGTGDESERLVPTPIVGHRFATIAVSRHHAYAATTTCGIDETLRLLCWGANDSGQLGNGTTEPSLVPTPVASSESYAAVAVVSLERQVGNGQRLGHVCALTKGMEVQCWGDNYSGQITLRGIGMSTLPVAIEGGPWTGIYVGAHDLDGLSCAIDVGGTAHCWGSDFVGWAFGGSLQPNFFEPTPVGTGISFRSLDLSPERTCGVDQEGKAYCWGLLPAPGAGSGTQLYERPKCLRGQVC